MIIFSKILGNKGTVYDALRVKHKKGSEVSDDLIRFSAEDKPIVMWNLTRLCNLKCSHCYADAQSSHPEELTFQQIKNTIDDLAEMKIPMIIFTGGEPLLRKEFFEIAKYVKEKGLKAVISTNGTTITPKVAKKLKEVGILYVGVSLDAGSEKKHDKFRGMRGSFKKALRGAINSKKAGIKSGFRITLTKDNYMEVPKLLNLALKHGIERFCIYHLVPTGRGKRIYDMDLTKEQRKEVLDFLYEKAIELKDKEIEILTTDGPCDGVYILERLKKEFPERYEDAKKLLHSSGCTVGKKVANIDYLGNVNPCHFLPEMSAGNVKEKKFSEIWKNPCEELLLFREHKKNLKGKCSRCQYVQICGGCRKKAYFVYGDYLQEDPTCLYEVS